MGGKYTADSSKGHSAKESNQWSRPGNYPFEEPLCCKKSYADQKGRDKPYEELCACEEDQKLVQRM